MRRIYYVTPKRKKIEEEALKQLRRTRKLIDPALLDSMRRLIADKMPPSAASLQREDGQVPVDHGKNVRIISRFIEMKADDPAFCRRVQSMFSESLQ